MGIKKVSKGQWALIVVFLVLLVDQFSKIWVKTHMVMYQSFEITPWFYIYFTENNGMAYGIELFNKLFLTLFRIAAVIFFSFYLHKCVKRQFTTGYIVCVALIIAGATGNIIDSVFYGQIFTDSIGHVAQIFPKGGGYAPIFYGKVVDILYFPLLTFNWPSWVPYVGGTEYLFFRPIFNVADSAITVGVILLIIFYRHHLGDNKQAEEVEVKEEA